MSEHVENSGEMALGKILFSFTGRIGRATFWVTWISISVLDCVFGLLMAGMREVSPVLGLACLLWVAAVAWVGLAVQVKRWHDRNRSGGMVLINLIPVIGWVWSLIELGLLRGTVESNRYGASNVVGGAVSRVAVASWLLSLLGISPPGLLFGIIGLVKVNRSKGALRGRALALGAIVLSTIGLLVWTMGLVGGLWLQRSLYKANSAVQVVGTYGEQGKVRINDIRRAKAELEILKMLRIKEFSWPTVEAAVLCELLYQDGERTEELRAGLKRAVTDKLLDAAPIDIDGFFDDKREPGVLYWILLVAEAEATGNFVSEKEARIVLQSAVPLLYSERVHVEEVVGGISRVLEVQQSEVVGAFASFLTVLEHVNDVAVGEIINAEYVKIDAMKLLDAQWLPTENEIQRQFESYRQVPSGLATRENPFGFGYMLPKRVEAEYVLVDIGDVVGVVEKPSRDELWSYYYRYRAEKFTRSERRTPGDPNSEMVTRTMGSVEEVGDIDQAVRQEKAEEIAETVMHEILDAAVARGESDPGVTWSLAEITGPCADRIGFSLVVGETGVVDQEDVLGDDSLAGLVVEENGGRRRPIDRWIFSPDTKREREPNDTVIGLVVDGKSRRGVVRVVQVYDPIAPSSGSLATPEMANVRDQVIQDCRVIQAVEAAQRRAKAFARNVVDEGWENAIGSFNGGSPGRSFVLESNSLRRHIRQDERVEAELAELPKDLSERSLEMSRIREAALVDDLYRLIPAGERDAKDIVEIIQPALCMNYYVVRNVARVQVEPYGTGGDEVNAEWTRLETAGRKGYAVRHFRPRNILKRLRFRYAPAE